jgi:hypothetical protein
MMQPETKLPEHKVVPLWTLPDKYGENFNLAKRRGRDHFILLVCASGADPEPFLDQLAPRMADLRTFSVAGLVVGSSEDVAGPLPAPPFKVLIDAEGKVRDRYLPPDAVAGLFLLDRYADLYRQWVVRNVAELPSAEEVAGWMQAIGMQCSV